MALQHSVELAPGEPHPAAFSALQYIKSLPIEDFSLMREVLASTALANNRGSSICLETWDRLTRGDSVSDRYLLGLAWTIRSALEERNTAPPKGSSERGEGTRR